MSEVSPQLNQAETPNCTLVLTAGVNLSHHGDIRHNGLICLSLSLQPHPRELWFSITTDDHASNFTVKLELNEYASQSVLLLLHL